MKELRKKAPTPGATTRRSKKPIAAPAIIRSSRLPDPREDYEPLGLEPKDPPAEVEPILEKRYYDRDNRGQLSEDFSGLCDRVSRAVAQGHAINGQPDLVDAARRTYFELNRSGASLPNSPTLMNAGKRLGQLSACFVLPVEDSMAGIFTSVLHQALIHQSGGGTGFSFSRLRPRGDLVGSTKGVASGPLSFMKVFDTATEMIKQGGTRRGANMGLLRVDHPDILEFIRVKSDKSLLTNFNLSVGLTDAFQAALEAGTHYDLINPNGGRVVGSLPAREVMDLIVDEAWSTGEPGIVFLDAINRFNPTPHLGPMESTNPCGEQPLLPYESCNLASVNLVSAVRNGRLDLDLLRAIVRRTVLFLDDVVDVNRYPLPEIEKMTRGNRKIGLGVMGWADLLFLLGVPYGSEESLTLARKVMSSVDRFAEEKSRELAAERGPYPNFVDHDGKGAIRNATRTTIAPTGTISQIAGCSGGIEPMFSLGYERRWDDNQTFRVLNQPFVEAMKARNLWSDELAAKVCSTLSIQGMTEIPEDIRRVFVTASDVPGSKHVEMQAAFQEFTNNAVSKTVNLPREATKAQVEEIFLLAARTGCKGVTIYRDGSRENQVLSVATAPATSKKESSFRSEKDPNRLLEVTVSEQKVLQFLAHFSRPQFPAGNESRTFFTRTPEGSLGIEVGRDDTQRPFEVWAKGNLSGSLSRLMDALAKATSYALWLPDVKYHRELMDLYRSVSSGRSWVVDAPPNGEEVRVPSAPAALALFLEYEFKRLGWWDKDGDTPLMSALLVAEHPVTGHQGTAAHTVDIQNAMTGDNFTLIIREMALPNGQRRPYEISTAVTRAGQIMPPDALVALCRKWSLDARVSDLGWLALNLRQLVNQPEPNGSFRALDPITGRSHLFPSTVAYVVRQIQYRFFLLGLFDEKGFPVERSLVEDSAAGGRKHGEVLVGSYCPECHCYTVVPMGGCEICTNCRAQVGNCG